MKTIRLLITLACVALAAITPLANAAPGDLDLTFGGTGKVVTTNFGNGSDGGRSVAVQGDGKIVVAGLFSNTNISVAGFGVMRFNADGTLDFSFGSGGRATAVIGGGAFGYSVVIQNDGKIIVAGEAANATTSAFAVARFNDDGSLDTSFGGTGKVTTGIGFSAYGRSVAIHGDSKIVVAGTSTTNTGVKSVAVVRYNTDGTLDTSFNGTGKVTTALDSDSAEATSVALSYGKIVVATNSKRPNSYNFTLLRYINDGSLDNAFGSNGKVTTFMSADQADCYGVTLQYDGKIVLAGRAYNGTDNGFAVVRYHGDDLPDTDGDGIPDAYETGTGVYVSPTDTGTSPTNPDTDGEGLNDGSEISTYHTNPTLADTDGDGFSDGFEVSIGFSPTPATSTPDAVSTILPAVEYRFNAALGVSYRIEASFDLNAWTTIETPIIGTGGVIRRLYFIDGEQKRFFRSRRN